MIPKGTPRIYYHKRLGRVKLLTMSCFKKGVNRVLVQQIGFNNNDRPDTEPVVIPWRSLRRKNIWGNYD